MKKNWNDMHIIIYNTIKREGERSRKREIDSESEKELMNYSNKLRLYFLVTEANQSLSRGL